MAERCCPQGQCAYRPSLVRVYLSHIRAATLHGEDPGEAADAALGSKGEGGVGSTGGGSGLAHNAVRVWDVQQAQARLGRGASAEAIAKVLCPFAMEGSDITQNGIDKDCHQLS